MKNLITLKVFVFVVLLSGFVPVWAKVSVVEINNGYSQDRSVKLDEIAKKLEERFCAKSIGGNVTSSERNVTEMDFDSIARKFYQTKVVGEKLDDGYDWEKIFWAKVEEFNEFLRIHAELLDEQEDSESFLKNILLVSEWCSQ